MQFACIKLIQLFDVSSTLLTTPANASLLQPYLDRHSTAADVKLHVTPFPSSDLPVSCENTASIPSQELESVFFAAVTKLQEPIEQLVKQLRPDCVVADAMFSWTHDVFEEMGIPRIVFHGTSFFGCCALDSLIRLGITDHDGDRFVIPGLAHRITMHFSQLPDPRELLPFFLDLHGKMRETEPKSYGIMMNSFYELEPEYARHYREVIGRRAWCVGPASLFSKHEDGRGGESQIDRNACLDWLGTQRPGSVVYVCFGSVSVFSESQVREIASGLVRCGHPFLWAVRGAGTNDDFVGVDHGKGLVVRGWAPQTAILGDGAVGGFLTHCGWNSSLEGISAGLPLATWPLFAEQFFNERLIVDVLKIGVGVGAKEYTVKQKERPVVEAERIAAAIREVMGEGEEAEGRRKRARELGEMAKRAVEEGGSSYEDITSLIKELMMRKKTR